MIAKELGGIILVILPFLSMVTSLLMKSNEKRRLQEVIFFTTIVICIFFSYQYTKVTQMRFNETGEHNLVFLERFFLNFFGNPVIPVIYFLALTLIYLILRKYIIRPEM